MTHTNSASIKTLALHGTEAIEIEVQAHISSGLPGFIICGLPDKAISESRDRIRSAFAHLGIAFISKRLVINMSPANIRKEGTHYDLPIAIAILKVMGFVTDDTFKDCFVIGELSLNGNIMYTPGSLVSAIYASSHKHQLVCSYACIQEASIGAKDSVIAFHNIRDIIEYSKNCHDKVWSSQYMHHDAVNITSRAHSTEPELDIADVLGHDHAKRAMEIAAAGGHHMLMIGSPGAGKSMLAMRMSSLLPELNKHEAIETASIYSIAGNLQSNIFQRPFRDPHHNTSIAAMLGGGQNAAPGEISLAHNGILFMDELTLWPTSVLNGLRESLETGYITVSRANGHYKYRARYQLIAAANPCPCGKAYDADVICNKLPHCSRNYLQRIPGPILDRISLIVSIHQQEPWVLRNMKTSESSQEIRARVYIARQRQQARYIDYSNISTNNDAISTSIDLLHIAQSSIALLNKFAEKNKLSGRGYFNIQKIARTIADLSNQDDVNDDHMLEAISFRSII